VCEGHILWGFLLSMNTERKFVQEAVTGLAPTVNDPGEIWGAGAQDFWDRYSGILLEFLYTSGWFFAF